MPHPKYVKAIRGKRKAARISRAGAYIKPLLTQYALAAIKAKKRHPGIFNRYSNLKKRRGTRKPIIAIARELVVSIYVMFKKMS